MKLKVSTPDNVYVYLTRDKQPVIITEVDFLAIQPLKGIIIKESNELIIEHADWSYDGRYAIIELQTSNLDISDVNCIEVGKATHPLILDILESIQTTRDKQLQEYKDKVHKSKLSDVEIINKIRELLSYQ